MKSISLNHPGTVFLLLFSAAFIISSCSFSIKSGSTPDRNDVVGSWELDEPDNQNTQGNNTVFQFKLKPDSTATISMGKTRNILTTGNWEWKKKKQVGNDRFGLSLQSDVVIYINNHLVLGMVLKETNGKLQLEVGDLSFKKTSESSK